MMDPSFTWPAGKRGAVSLSFDDARVSQIEQGMPVLESFGLRGTFYVCIPEITTSRDAWRTAAARGHEIGNHTVNHPCTGNFVWCKAHLEDYTLAMMEADLTGAQTAIHQALGV